MSFYDQHPFGLLLLFFMLVCPRLTFIIGMMSGVLDIHWTVWGLIGGVFIPRIVACIIATGTYWDTNPILVVFAWIFAVSTLGGSTTYTTKKHNNSN